MEKEKAPHVTKADIEEFLRLEDERKSLQRQAEDLERQAAPIKEKLNSFVELKGGTARTVERSGYVLAIKTKNGQIAWKSEFLRVAGPVETAQVAANPPKRDYLSIEKVG